MPQMVLSRNYVLTSTFNHTIKFEKGKPVGVPPMLVKKALEIGAVMVNNDDIELVLPEEAKPVKGVPIGDERETAVFEAFRQLAEKNDPDDFTAGGKPKFKAVTHITGFRVDAGEVADLWQKYREMLEALRQGG